MGAFHDQSSNAIFINRIVKRRRGKKAKETCALQECVASSINFVELSVLHATVCWPRKNAFNLNVSAQLSRRGDVRLPIHNQKSALQHIVCLSI